MLHAIEAPLYDIGVLSDRGMMPGLDGIPAEKVLSKLPLLKQRNATGSHIYIRPSSASCGGNQLYSERKLSSRACGSAPTPRRSSNRTDAQFVEGYDFSGNLYTDGILRTNF